MLTRVFSPAETKKFQISIGEAAFPAPFSHSPEFNPPAHGCWNIVHVGMLVPEAHQIYVCGTNCMRGVVLTAAEMNASQRFSMVLLEERDLIEGTAEDTTIEGITAVLQKLQKLPPAVLVFTVCTHRFLGCDLNYIYHTLEQRFPTVQFLRCFMEPITQKEGLTPDQRLRKTMFDPLLPCPPKAKTAALLGSDFKLDPDADLCRMLAASGWTLRQAQDCETFAQFQAMGEAEVFFSVFPHASYGAQETARRLGRKHYYLPLSFSYEEIQAQERRLCEELGLCPLDSAAEQAACESALEQARQAVGGAAVAIDATACPRPLGLARLLLEHGFSVKTVYLDAVSAEEQGDFLALQKLTPELVLSASTQPQARVLPRGGKGPAVAVGQIAAWRENTPHFVNLVEGGGLWGYSGIRTMARLIAQAAGEEKDTRALIPRKGLGCECCL